MSSTFLFTFLLFYVFYFLFLLTVFIDCFHFGGHFFGCSLGFFLVFLLLAKFFCLFGIVFIICLGLCFFIYFFPFSLTMPCSLQALSSPGRSWALVSRVRALILRYWSAGQFPDSGNINWHVLPGGIYLDITTQLQRPAGTSPGHLTASNHRDNNTVPTISRQAA